MNSKSFSSLAKGIFFLIAAAFVVLLGYFLAFKPGWNENLQIAADVRNTNQPFERSITVDGVGKVIAKPDVAIMDLSVVSDGNTVKQVTTDGNEKMNKIVSAVKEMGVKVEDVQSTNYNLYPKYKYPENLAPSISGYTLSQTLTVKVRDLTKVDDVLSAGIDAGANQLGQFTFKIDDDTAFKQAARDKAFQAAKDKAEKMAEVAGVKLGKVITFNESYTDMPPVYPLYGMDSAKMVSAESAPAPAIESGSQEVTVTVSITYNID